MVVDTPTRTLKAYATIAADECDWAQREVKSSSSGELSRADTHDPIQPNEFTHRSESCTLVADEDAPVHLSNEPPAQTHGGLELVNEESSVQEKSSSTGYDPKHIPILSAMREYFAERTETFLPEKSLVINTMAGKELKLPLSISTVCELRQWVAQECKEDAPTESKEAPPTAKEEAKEEVKEEAPTESKEAPLPADPPKEEAKEKAPTESKEAPPPAEPPDEEAKVAPPPAEPPKEEANVEAPTESKEAPPPVEPPKEEAKEDGAKSTQDQTVKDVEGADLQALIEQPSPEDAEACEAAGREQQEQEEAETRQKEAEELGNLQKEEREPLEAESKENELETQRQKEAEVVSRKNLVITTMSGEELKPPSSIRTVGELREWVATKLKVGTLQVDLVNAGSILELDDFELANLRQGISLSVVVVLMRGIPKNLDELLSERLISGDLLNVMALGRWPHDFNVRLTISIGDKKRLVECRQLPLDMLVRVLPKFQDKQIDLRIEDIDPVRLKCIPSLKWFIEDDAIDDEMKRQSCADVGIRFCLQWHWHALGQSVHPGRIPCANSCGILCTDTSDKPSMCSESERSVKVYVIFKCLEALQEFLDEDSEHEDTYGSKTSVRNFLKDAPDEILQTWLVAMRMPPEYGNESSLADPKSLFQSIISPVPDSDDSVASDIELFHSFAQEIASSLKQSMQAALAFVLQEDASRAKVVPRHPDLKAWLPEFVLSTAPMTSSDFFCQYPRTAECFSKMAARNPHLQQLIYKFGLVFMMWPRREKEEESASCAWIMGKSEEPRGITGIPRYTNRRR